MPGPASQSIRRTARVTLGIAGTIILAASATPTGAERARDISKPRVSYGAPVTLGSGVARTFVVLNGDVPTEIGVALSEAVLTGLPGHDEPGAITMPDGHSMYEMELPLPAVNPTPIKLVVLNWNPGGHEPPGIYDAPHFDFHFYMIDAMARAGIVPTDSTFTQKASRKPASEFLPAGYVLPPDIPAIPMMGMHWVDPTSPELNGQPFTRTFIYGSWDGQVIFAEPMITKSYIAAKPDSTFALPSAGRYSTAGYHPTSYTIRWDEPSKEHRVSLSGLERRN